ncbi:MAG: acyl-CoA thioesterase [Verrucomicrobia bacterium]|nr:acyl-CoA thioesterase [Verrucomicrobiota bacterium]MBI3868356.1 acyl-CoA thioesterase [Verrucomicrobiota bacterium]
MAYEFSLRRRVEFAETDMAGIMHFSNFFRFMESAEAAFYRSLGFSIVKQVEGTGWPRVHAECDYASPLRFEDEVEVRLLVKEKRTRSISLLFKFLKMENGQEIVAARGAVTAVYITRSLDGALKATPIPEAFHQKVEAAPSDILGAWTK